jgi:uncharacterized membrane protein YfcA
MWTLVLVTTATFAAAALSAVAGFGGSVVMLPVFVAAFGAREAVAVLTVAQLASNTSRVVLNWAEVEHRLVRTFSLGAIPAAVAGSLLFATAPLPALIRGVGAFLLVVVVWRRLRPAAARLEDRAFVAVGAGFGFGSALLGAVGPVASPFFLARGLVRGAYIGTEAAAAVVIHLTKLLVFGAAAVLTIRTGLIGLALAPAAAAGAWTGKQLVDRLPVRVFTVLVEAGLVASGLLLLVKGA